MYLFSYSVHGMCKDYPSCDIAYNAVMPLSRAPTRGRYSRIVGVTYCASLPPGSGDRRGHSAPYGQRSPHDAALLPLSPYVIPDRRSPVPTKACNIRLADSGPYLAARALKTEEAGAAGPRRSQLPAGGRSLPRAPYAINQTRHGVGIVIAHQAAGL